MPNKCLYQSATISSDNRNSVGSLTDDALHKIAYFKRIGVKIALIVLVCICMMYLWRWNALLELSAIALSSLISLQSKQLSGTNKLITEKGEKMLPLSSDNRNSVGSLTDDASHKIAYLKRNS